MLDFYSFNNMETKKCGKCGEVKPISEFHKNKYTKDGLRYCCKECGKEYRENNTEKLKEYLREYRKNNPEKEKERKRKWRENNPEKIKEYKKDYYKNNTEKEKERSREYCENLHPSYVKHNLKQLGYTEEEITPELIEVKKETLKTKRLIKTIQQKLN